MKQSRSSKSLRSPRSGRCGAEKPAALVLTPLNLPARLSVREMRASDISQVKKIETISFDEKWPEDSYLQEIRNNKIADYIVMTDGDDVIGYAGMWLIMDEAHITTVAAHPRRRGKKIGTVLVWSLLARAIADNARWATLEVNVNNTPAQKIYESFGFTIIGRRKAYYRNGDNAHVMWAGNIQGLTFMNRMEAVRKSIEEFFKAG